MKIFVLSFFLLICSKALAQLPETDLYLLEFIELEDGLHIKKVKYLSGFNPKGYNNQPFFLSEDRVLIASNFFQADSTDILELNLDSESIRVRTRTRSSAEYSPARMPGDAYYTCVRQTGNIQKIWAFPLDNAGSGFDVLPKTTDVGYYCWEDANKIWTYRVSDAVTLSQHDRKTGRAIDKINDVGRCIKTGPDGQLLVVHKILNDLFYLKSLDPITGRLKIISEIDTEDFEVLPSYTFLKGGVGKIYKLSKNDDNWVEACDVSEYGIGRITRMASFRNKLIVVSQKISE